MDGTLLNSQKMLPPEFEQTYNDLKFKGIQFVVASGRPYYSLLPQFENFNHDIIFIGENGGIIAFKDKQVIISSFPKDGIEDIILQELKLPYTEMIICTAHKPYTYSKNPVFLNESKKYYPNIKVLEYPETIKDPILKFAIYDPREGNVNKQEPWISFNKDFVVEMSGDIWVDIMPKGVNKGAALKYLQEKWGITTDETMVFGDFHNDIEMLKYAKYSYAMENAHDDVKLVAKYIAPANDDNGVIRTINEMVFK